ncbi:MAG: DUF4178 domain-containing protein [Nannocystaceae bacterium]
MDGPGVFCPQCGAPAPFRGTLVTLVCEYCGSTIVRDGVDIALVGKVSALVDNGSPVLLGSRGRHRGVPFEIIGRLQVEYGRGHWNEWFLAFADGGTGWLSDALGQFAVTQPRARPLPLNAPFGAIAVGMVLAFDGATLTVVDRRAAQYCGSEGQLPMAATPSCTYYAVDLRGAAGEFVTLDWGESPEHPSPQQYVGTNTTLAQLGLHPLRTFQGWPRPQPVAAGAGP